MSDIAHRIEETIKLKPERTGQWPRRVLRDAKEEIERLRALIEGAPDPAFYKPEELEGAWLRWRKACGETSQTGPDTKDEPTNTTD